MTIKSRPTMFSALLLMLPLAAGASGDHAGGHGDDSAVFGEPADPGEADRTIKVIARDTMSFEPAQVDVKPGETVRFVVENVGDVQHSFTLGTPAGQEAHEKEMQGMAMEDMAGHMDNDPTGMVVQPGETGRLTWHFDAEGPVEFACHIPGHYPAGMKGRIRIERTHG